MSEKITPDFPPPDHAGFYTARHTDIEVLRRRCKQGDRMVFYGINTCWWAISWAQLYRTRPQTLTINGRQIASDGLPCDPRGGMLLQGDNVDLFFDSAVNNSAHYGKHGLRVFLAAYHGNVVVSQTDPRPTCFSSWDDYNRILDEHDARIQKIADDITKGNP